MKNSCLALCLFAIMACGRGGSAIRDAGGGAIGVTGSGGSSGADQSERGADAEAGSGGGTPTGTSSFSAPIGGGGGGGGATVSRASAMGGSSATNGAGRTADAGEIIAGRSAVGGSTGNACWLQTAYASRTTADLLLVLDRSGSMSNDIAEDCVCAGTETGTRRCSRAGCKDRWSTVAAAISTAISATPNIHWGLKLFYSPAAAGSAGDARAADNLCRVSAEIEVPIGADSGPAILSAIQTTIPQGNTPTRAAILAASAYLKSLADQNGKYILLATDGMPNCPADSRSTNVLDFAETATAISGAGFPVYVLGIGPSEYELQSFAVVAGTAHYYPATSPEQLTSALSAITETVATCTFTLSASPPDAGKMTVFLDQTALPKDDNNGWSFARDTRTFVLHGDSCKMLKASTASTLKVQVDCPP